MSLSLITPSFLLHKINYVYYKTPEDGLKAIGTQKQIEAMSEEKEKIRQEEYRLIKRIKEIPDCLIKEN